MHSSPKNNFVIVGMSGGVDSSVTALLLKKQGYHVEGLFMKNWEEDTERDEKKRGCSAIQDLTDARAVCSKIGIRLHVVNFTHEYWDRVFTYFLDEYKAGRTPNPDVMCNKEIKFKAFLEHAIALGAGYIATGHFVRKKEDNAEYYLLKGLDKNKDQSYFLYLLNQYQLSKALFPVGELEKNIVRNIAKESGFINHNKKDSTGICFIGERKFKQFLSQYLPAQPGNIETDTGKIIGTHDGLMYYTIGQRQGLGIGGKKDATESPWYVLSKEMKRNVLIIGQGHDHPLLLASTLIANQLHWINHAPQFPFTCQAKTRYRQSDQICTIQSAHQNEVLVQFKNPQRAVTPGQSIVFYQDEICLGGGIIVKST